MSVAIRNVTIGKRSLKYVKKIAKSLNLSLTDMYNKIIEEWISDHSNDYSITVPDTFIHRSVSISENNWSLLSKIAEKRKKSCSRLFAIVLDEWVSRQNQDEE